MNLNDWNYGRPPINVPIYMLLDIEDWSSVAKWPKLCRGVATRDYAIGFTYWEEGNTLEPLHSHWSLVAWRPV